jgi:hypothetical protein
VIDGLRAELRRPEVLTAYAREYHDERQRLATQANRNAATLERRLGGIKRETERLVDHLAKGIGDPQIVGDRMKAVVAEGREIEAKLAAAHAEPKVIALHPAALKRYEQQLANLHESIGKAVEAGDRKLADAIGDLVETVTVRRKSDRGVEVEIAGRLNALLGDQAFPNGRRFSGGNAGSGGGI